MTYDFAAVSADLLRSPQHPPEQRARDLRHDRILRREIDLSAVVDGLTKAMTISRRKPTLARDRALKMIAALGRGRRLQR